MLCHTSHFCFILPSCLEYFLSLLCSYHLLLFFIFSLALHPYFCHLVVFVLVDAQNAFLILSIFRYLDFFCSPFCSYCLPHHLIWCWRWWAYRKAALIVVMSNWHKINTDLLLSNNLSSFCWLVLPLIFVISWASCGCSQPCSSVLLLQSFSFSSFLSPSTCHTLERKNGMINIIILNTLVFHISHRLYSNSDWTDGWFQGAYKNVESKWGYFSKCMYGGEGD